MVLKGKTVDKKQDEDNVRRTRRDHSRAAEKEAGRLCPAKYDRDGELPVLMDNCSLHSQASPDFSAHLGSSVEGRLLRAYRTTTN